MKKTLIITATLGLAFSAQLSVADTILYYDSVTGGTALNRIASQTDSSFVSSSDAVTSLSSNTSFVQQHASGVSTVTEGNGKDMQFRFGGDNEVLNGSLADAAEAATGAATGEWIGMNFTAAKDLKIDSFSFKMFVNSNAGKTSARDAGLFIRIGSSGAFTQYGSPYDGTTTGDQGTITFTDAFEVLSGQEVQLRLAFTDRTNIAGGAQTKATRIGSFNISATSPYYFDVDGTTAGFGNAAGSYTYSSAFWTSSSAGTATPEVWANGRELHFGHVGTTGISGNTLSIDFAGTSSFAGLNINQPATVTFAGNANANLFPSTDQTWQVVSGATLNMDLDWDSNGTVSGGLNHGQKEITLVGGGTINFNSAVLMNAQDGHFDQNDAALTVNLAAAANWDATPLQGNYILNAGNLNFSNIASAAAFAKMDASKTVTLNGGVLDNTSGAPLTLDIGSGTYMVGGNFAFTGTDDLNLGVRSMDLNNGTRTITVAANALEIGGVITDGGIIKEGSGTLVLSGNNTYTGTTTVNGGILKLGSSLLPNSLKVMPLGDSITYGFGGSSGQSGYRNYLYEYLEPVMPSYQFVGVKNGIPNGSNLLPTSPIDQRHHQGMPSYKIEEVNNNLDGLDNSVFTNVGGAQRDPEGGYWLDGDDDPGYSGASRAAINPDIILIMLGTNDWQIPTGDRARLNALLTKLVTMRPNAHLIVANIVPANNATRNAAAIDFNKDVDAEIALFRENGHHVSGLDLHTGFPSNGLTNDGVHPNTTGYLWMAKQWNNAVNAIAKEFPDNNATPANFSLIHSSLVTISSAGSLDLDGNQTGIKNLTVAGNLILDGGALSVSDDLILQSTSTLQFGVGSTSDQVAVANDLTMDGTINLTDTGGFTAGTYTLFTYSGSLTDNELMIGTTPDSDLLYEIDTSTTGVVKLIVQTAFEAWQKENFGNDADNPLIAGPTVDFDLDGQSNKLEYYMGGDPTNPLSRGQILVAGASGASPVVTYQRALNRPDVTAELKWSTDLSNWRSSGESDGSRLITITETVISGPGADPETVEATITTTSGAASDRIFVRLLIN